MPLLSFKLLPEAFLTFPFQFFLRPYALFLSFSFLFLFHTPFLTYSLRPNTFSDLYSEDYIVCHRPHTCLFRGLRPHTILSLQSQASTDFCHSLPLTALPCLFVVFYYCLYIALFSLFLWLFLLLFHYLALLLLYKLVLFCSFCSISWYKSGVFLCLLVVLLLFFIQF